MLVVDVKDGHCIATAGAMKRIVTEGKQDGFTPAIKTKKNLMLLTGYCSIEFGV